MAITIDSNPASQYSFAYRPNVWTVSSNDVNIVRCIADVYINGSYSVSLEKSPDIGTTDTFTFDIQSALQDNLKAFEPNFTASRTYPDTNAGLYYTIRFFEVLDNGTTFDTSWAEDGAGTSYVDSNTVYNPAFAYNGTLRHEETHDLDVFVRNGTYAGHHRINKLTTTYGGVSTNKARKIKRSDWIVLSSHHDTATTIRGRIIQYDSSDSIISDSTSSDWSSGSRFWHYAVDVSAGGLVVGDNTKKILVRMERTTGTGITDYALYEVVEDCNDYVSLYWQNDIGGIDYYLFRDGQVKQYEGESKSFTKPLSTSYNVYDFGETVLSKESNISVSAVSEVLDRTEADALSNLITHAVRAWIYDGSNFIPVIVKDGNIETINTLDGEYRLNVELMYSNKLITQRF